MLGSGCRGSGKCFQVSGFDVQDSVLHFSFQVLGLRLRSQC